MVHISSPVQDAHWHIQPLCVLCNQTHHVIQVKQDAGSAIQTSVEEKGAGSVVQVAVEDNEASSVIQTSVEEKAGSAKQSSGSATQLSVPAVEGEVQISEGSVTPAIEVTVYVFCTCVHMFCMYACVLCARSACIFMSGPVLSCLSYMLPTLIVVPIIVIHHSKSVRKYLDICVTR
jgi:hypothetical protein